MNCPKCNSLLKEGAKFCTSCGEKMTPPAPAVSSTCPQCASPLKPNSKFCTACGAKIAQTVAPPDATGDKTAPAMSMVKQKLTWNIQPGEIARRINETEMMQYDTATGIIINEGTTAHITANGKQLAKINGGSYDFVDPKELNELLEKRTGGLVGKLKQGARFLMNLLLEKTVKDKIGEQDSSIDHLDTMDKVVEHLNKDTVFSLIIKQDKSFQLLFGAAQNSRDAYADFQPMTVKTKILDTNIGIRAFFTITDFDKFSEYYLGDSSFVTTASLTDYLTPLIKNAVQEVMQDVELTDSKIPQDVVQKIFSRIKDLPVNVLNGISIENIVEIVSEQKDLERFRELCKELYLSEKELDYLIRTNDFRNRLSSQENAQIIYEARSAQDLHRKLDAINRDKLIVEDDLEKFYMLLSREKIIREAKNEDEIAAALAEIEKTGLLRQEDIDNIRYDIQERQDKRNFSIAMTRLGNDIEFRRKEWEKEEVDLEGMRKIRLGAVDIEVEEQRRRDEYQLKMETEKRKTQMELDDLEMNKQMELMRQLKNMERDDASHQHSLEMEAKAQQMKHEQDLENMRFRELEMKYSSAKDLTPEQLMAIAANENLSPEAAAKFAESFSSNRNAEQQKEFLNQVAKLNEQRVSDAKENMDRMERMMAMMLQNKDDQKNEYKQRLERQEQRLDSTQDKALDYTTRNNVQQYPQYQQAMPPQQYQQTMPPPQYQQTMPPLQYQPATPGAKAAHQDVSTKVCKGCQAEVGANDRFCESCGGEV